MNKEDGGPAFPAQWPIRQGADSVGGMSLRDYFAAAALTGSREDLPEDIIATSCYKIADAMLAAREK